MKSFLLLSLMASAMSFISGCAGGTKTHATAVVSSLSGTGPVVADGVAVSIISMNLRDTEGNPFSGMVPRFIATDSGGSNRYGTCSVADGNGNSTCTLSSERAETKSLKLVSPFVLDGGSVVFTPAPQNKLVFTQAQSNTSPAGAGFAQTPVIEIRDAHDNLVTTSTNSVSLSGYLDSHCTVADSGNINAPSSTSGGIVTFSSMAYSKAGTIYFKASSSGLVSTCSPTSTLITPSTAYQTAFAIQPSTSAVAGVAYPTQPTVEIQDQYGNRVRTGSDSTLSVTLTAYSDSNCATPIGGVFSVNSNPLNAVTGAIAFAGVKSTLAQPIYLKAYAPGMQAGCSSAVSVTAAAANSANSQITGTSSTAANSVDYSVVTVTLQDQYGNPRAGDVPTFSATNTGGTNVYGTCTAGTVLGISTCKLYSHNAETKVLQLLTPTSVTGGSVVFIAPPTSGNSTLTLSGGPFVANDSDLATFSVTLHDSSGVAVVGVTPRLSSSGTGNTLAACAATNASGASTCTLKSTKAEVKSVTLTEPVALGPVTVSFGHGAASKLVFSTSPSSSVVAGQALAQSPTIQIQDSFGNLVNTTASAALSVSLSAYNDSACTTSAGGIFSATNNPQTASSGVATVNGVSETLSGPLYLKASASGVTSVCSNLITVSPAAAASIRFSTAPSAAAEAGTALNTQPEIEIRDAYGNRTTTGSDSTRSITLTAKKDAACSTNGTGTLSADANPMSASAGIASFSNLKYTKVEPFYLKASASGLPTICSSAIVMSASAVSAAQSTITGTSSVVANGTSASTVSIQLNDVYSNPVVGTTPTFSATDTRSGNTYGVCTVSSSSGISTCDLKSTTAETKLLHLASPVALDGGSVTFIAGAASSLIFSVQPSTSSPVQTNLAQSPQVELQDANGNLVSGTVASVQLSAFTDSSCSVSGTGTLSAIQNPLNTAAGHASFSNVKYNSDETVYLKASSGSYSSGCSNAVEFYRWNALSNASAPTARYDHTAVWTGSQMIVFGGRTSGGSALNTGGVYTLASDSWSATALTNAPNVRFQHSAIWTGSKMIVWGGTDGSSYFSTGFLYDPSSGNWSAISNTNAPTGRSRHAAVWTGSKMIIWGGYNGSSYLNTGAIYDPSANTWSSISTSGAPTGRADASASFSGTQFYLFGGTNGSVLDTGATYNFSNSTWTTLATANAPTARKNSAGLGSNTQLFVWGGEDASSALASGSLYTYATGLWSTISSVSAPSARTKSFNVWTGTDWWIWGGESGGTIAQDGASLQSSTWTPLAHGNRIPVGRYSGSAVWTGSKILIWGGCSGALPCGTTISSGASYTP